MAWRIDDFVVDPEVYEIRRAGTVVPVEPQVFDLLVLLIANRQRALGKDEIIERIWEGRIVSDATLSSRIRTARQALGDDGSAQRLIRTIHGRGFRFVGDVEEIGRAVASSGPGNGIHVPGADGDSVSPDMLPKTDVMLAAGNDQAALLPARRGWAVAPALVAAATATMLAGLYLFSRAAGWSGVSSPQSEPISVSVAPQAPRPAFKDCETCPEMVVLPEGFFMMGGAPADKRRWNVELPQHVVRIQKPFAIGKFEVTVDEFAAFVDATGHQPAARCNVLVLDLDRWVGKDTTFRDPHYPQSGTHPASCINWLDAKAYAAWLNDKTGKPYRLPTEAEWEYAARAGTTTPLSFGDYTHARPCDHTKFADASTRFAWRDPSCSSDFGHGAAPVGRHLANAWGLHDMHGNVWEWVEDCWHASYDGAPTDGKVWLEESHGDCSLRITRGGSWRNAIQDLRVTARIKYPQAHAAQVRGFRVALPLD
jgi:formylglycine-generating enzyme required for sulfatase activity/DNA-binding winged helix-turn-helix (wHTH) protein